MAKQKINSSDVAGESPEVRVFSKLARDLVKEMRDPELADGECDWVSQQFEQIMQGSPQAPGLHPDAERWVLYGVREGTALKFDPDLCLGEVWHVVVRCGDQFFDWTARQFDPTAPVPSVYTRADLERDWVNSMPYHKFDAWERAQISPGDQSDSEEQPAVRMGP